MRDGRTKVDNQKRKFTTMNWQSKRGTLGPKYQGKTQQIKQLQQNSDGQINPNISGHNINIGINTISFSLLCTVCYFQFISVQTCLCKHNSLACDPFTPALLCFCCFCCFYNPVKWLSSAEQTCLLHWVRAWWQRGSYFTVRRLHATVATAVVYTNTWKKKLFTSIGLKYQHRYGYCYQWYWVCINLVSNLPTKF